MLINHSLFVADGWTGYLNFRDRIAEATDQRRYPITWLDDQILRGFYKVWANDRACIVAGIKVYPTMIKDVEGIVAAGDDEAIVELIPKALEWGRDNGCKQGLIESRPAWVRVLKPFGWEVHQTTIRKEL